MMIGDDEAKIFTNKKDTCLRRYRRDVLCRISSGDGTGLGCSIVLYCMTMYVPYTYTMGSE